LTKNKFTTNKKNYSKFKYNRYIVIRRRIYKAIFRIARLKSGILSLNFYLPRNRKRLIVSKIKQLVIIKKIKDKIHNQK
jgi:hypothetical protein